MTESGGVEAAQRNAFTRVCWSAQAGADGQGRNGFYKSAGIEIWERDPETARDQVAVALSGITSRGQVATGYVTIYGKEALNEVAAKLADIAREPSDPNSPTALLAFAREVLESVVGKAPSKHAELRGLARKASLKIRSPWFVNSYACTTCKTTWEDEWDATCDSDCPNCGQTSSPASSEDRTEFVDP